MRILQLKTHTIILIPKEQVPGLRLSPPQPLGLLLGHGPFQRREASLLTSLFIQRSSGKQRIGPGRLGPGSKASGLPQGPFSTYPGPELALRDFLAHLLFSSLKSL